MSDKKDSGTASNTAPDHASVSSVDALRKRVKTLEDRFDALVRKLNTSLNIDIEGE